MTWLPESVEMGSLAELAVDAVEVFPGTDALMEGPLPVDEALPVFPWLLLYGVNVS